MVALLGGCAHAGTDPGLSDDTRFGDRARACDSAGNAIVVASADGDFYRFFPDSHVFERISHASCSADKATGCVWAAAIDRKGGAWAQYAGEPPNDVLPPRLYPVKVEDGSCGAPIAYDPADVPSTHELTAGSSDGALLGVRLRSPNGNSEDPADTMHLVVFDTKTARVTSSTRVLFEPFHMPIDVAITQATDGSISAFFNALDA